MPYLNYSRVFQSFESISPFFSCVAFTNFLTIHFEIRVEQIFYPWIFVMKFQFSHLNT